MTIVNEAPAQDYSYYQGEAPGYATTEGGPAPLGESAPHMMAGAPGQPSPTAMGSRDPSLMMSGYSPTPVIPLGANRPRVLSHLFGFSEIGRDWREIRGRRAEESHAMIPYGATAPVVDALPARMVYGR